MKTLAPIDFRISANFTDGEFRISSLPALNDMPKIAIFLLYKFPTDFFILFTMCCGMDSFSFHAVDTMLENVVLLSKNSPSLLRHGPPANPGMGIFERE